jgi:hypothetical protein
MVTYNYGPKWEKENETLALLVAPKPQGSPKVLRGFRFVKIIPDSYEDFLMRAEAEERTGQSEEKGNHKL